LYRVSNFSREVYLSSILLQQMLVDSASVLIIHNK